MWKLIWGFFFLSFRSLHAVARKWSWDSFWTIQGIPKLILENYSSQTLKYITLCLWLGIFWGTVFFHILFWHMDVIEIICFGGKYCKKKFLYCKERNCHKFHDTYTVYKWKYLIQYIAPSPKCYKISQFG